jgi:hypothetical protein
MSGCPVRQVRHIYRRNGGGPITNYSTIGGICKICPPPPPPPPPRPPVNIEFRVFSAIPYSVTFELKGGTGSYDLGDGVLLPFSALVLPVTITGIVPVGGTVLIYGNAIETFKTTDQPVSYLDLSNCPTLKELECSQTISGQSYLTGTVNLSGKLNLISVDFTNTLISSLTGVEKCALLVNIFLSTLIVK